MIRLFPRMGPLVLFATLVGGMHVCYAWQTQSPSPARSPATGSQEGAPATPNASAKVPPSPSASGAAGSATSSADFVKTADQVLAQMSGILSLPVKKPLKKSLRSRQQIRDY